MSDCGCTDDRLCRFHAAARDAAIRRASDAGRYLDALQRLHEALGSDDPAGALEAATEPHSGSGDTWVDRISSEYEAAAREALADGRIAPTDQGMGCGGCRQALILLHGAWICLTCDGVALWPHRENFYDQETDQ